MVKVPESGGPTRAVELKTCMGLFNAQRYEEATERFAKSHESKPLEGKFLLTYARSLARVGRNGEALHFLPSLMNTCRSDHSLIQPLGRLAVGVRAWPEALDIWHSLSMHTHDLEVLRQVVRAASMTGDLRRAKVAAYTLVKLGKAATDCYACLVRIYCTEEDFISAAKTAASGTEMLGGDFVNWLNRLDGPWAAWVVAYGLRYGRLSESDLGKQRRKLYPLYFSEGLVREAEGLFLESLIHLHAAEIFSPNEDVDRAIGRVQKKLLGTANNGEENALLLASYARVFERSDHDVHALLVRAADHAILGARPHVASRLLPSSGDREVADCHRRLARIYALKEQWLSAAQHWRLATCGESTELQFEADDRKGPAFEKEIEVETENAIEQARWDAASQLVQSLDLIESEVGAVARNRLLSAMTITLSAGERSSDEVEQILDICLQLTPDHTALLVEAARVSARRSDRLKELSFWRLASRSAQATPDAMAQLAICARAVGLRAEAAEAARGALAADSSLSSTYPSLQQLISG